MLVASGAAINVDDIGIRPINPDTGQFVDVTATVDAENSYITSVELTILRNSTEILNANMDYVEGDRYEIADYEYLDAFNLTNEQATYYITVDALADNGQTDSGSIVLEYDGTLDIIEDLDPSTDNATLFGQDLGVIVAMITFVSLIYVILRP